MKNVFVALFNTPRQFCCVDLSSYYCCVQHVMANCTYDW